MASEDVSPEAPRPLNCDKAHVELNWNSVLSIAAIQTVANSNQADSSGPS